MRSDVHWQYIILLVHKPLHFLKGARARSTLHHAFAEAETLCMCLTQSMDASSLANGVLRSTCSQSKPFACAYATCDAAVNAQLTLVMVALHFTTVASPSASKPLTCALG